MWASVEKKKKKKPGQNDTAIWLRGKKQNRKENEESLPSCGVFLLTKHAHPSVCVYVRACASLSVCAQAVRLGINTVLTALNRSNTKSFKNSICVQCRSVSKTFNTHFQTV